MTIQIQPPFQNFTGLDGKPLTNGKVYIGQVGTDPTVGANQIPVFWDEEMTIPATQPLSTNAGYIVRLGAPSQAFTDVDYSITVLNASNVLVYYKDKAGAADFVSAAELAGPEGAAMVGFSQDYTGAEARTALDKLRENVSAADFGAINDGVQSPARGAANRIAIQEAIDAMSLRGGGVVTVGGGGIYYVDVTTYFKENGAIDGICTFVMKDNVSLVIEHGTTIKLMDFQYGLGAYYRMFSSKDENMLQNARISGGGTVDGNVANQNPSGNGADVAAQCSNIQLECRKNVVVEDINSINSNGIGIMLRGRRANGFGQTAQLAEKLWVLDCNVDNCKNIGIQCTSFTGLVIADNNVTDCVNNAIDVYGNDGTTTTFSYNFTITGNVVNGCLTGIFLETVRLGTVDSNTITLADYGIIVNRINGEPRGLVVSNNTTLSCPIGMRITGDTRGVSILGNTFDQFSTSGINCGDGGSSSYIIIKGNTFVPVANNTAIINIMGTAASFITGRSNTIIVSDANESFFVTALITTTQTNVSIGGFEVLPNQVGPDGYAELFESPVIRLGKPSQRFTNIAGPGTITIPDDFTGEVLINGYQPGSGRATRRIRFMKRAGTLILGTQVDDPVFTATPFTTATAVSGNLQINFVAGAQNYASWGIIGTKIIA